MTAATTPRRRLDADERRRQLIELGIEMLSAHPREGVAIDRIAEAAGISRGLLFHYFPTKRDYHVAVIQAAADRLLDVTAPPAEGELADRLRTSLDAYIDFVVDNQAVYVSLVRGAVGGDDDLQEIFDRTRGRIVTRIADALGMDARRPALRTALRGWIGFVEESTLDWLRHDDLSRRTLIGLQEQALTAVLGEPPA
jgi:AcrR family transcriptional regulator